MIWIVIAVVAIALVVVFFFRPSKEFNTDDPCYTYEKLDTLFSPAEHAFLTALTQAVEDTAFVFGKVRVADVITPLRGMTHQQWRASIKRIRCRHFDFILLDKDDLSILCAIELRDKSHNTKLRKDRDEILISACEAANLPLIEIPAQSEYNVDEIRQSLIQHLST